MASSSFLLPGWLAIWVKSVPGRAGASPVCTASATPTYVHTIYEHHQECLCAFFFCPHFATHTWSASAIKHSWCKSARHHRGHTQSFKPCRCVMCLKKQKKKNSGLVANQSVQGHCFWQHSWNRPVLFLLFHFSFFQTCTRPEASTRPGLIPLSWSVVWNEPPCPSELLPECGFTTGQWLRQKETDG